MNAHLKNGMVLFEFLNTWVKYYVAVIKYPHTQLLLLFGKLYTHPSNDVKFTFNLFDETLIDLTQVINILC